MKIIVKSLVLISFFLGTQLAIAGSFTDYATVTSVEKVYKQYRTEEPYQECYIQETLQNAGDGSATNEIIGAILGGAIGNKIAEDSSDTGKDVMTLAGIILGASIANDAEKANSTGQKNSTTRILTAGFKRSPITTTTGERWGTSTSIFLSRSASGKRYAAPSRSTSLVRA